MQPAAAIARSRAHARWPPDARTQSLGLGDLLPGRRVPRRRRHRFASTTTSWIASPTSFSRTSLCSAPAPTRREIDYARFRRTCDRVGAKLLADMAHISGLVAARLVAVAVRLRRRRHHHHAQDAARAARRARVRAPPRSCRPSTAPSFPRCRAGRTTTTSPPSAPACTRRRSRRSATTSASVQRQCARARAAPRATPATRIVTGGTDLHLLLVDVRRSRGVDGERAAAVCERASIVTNANTVPSDKTRAAAVGRAARHAGR
jgi:glycine/serine hydroxymethyltransferase